MSLYVDGINGLTFPDGSAQPTSGYTGFRNRIINGAMVIDQRNSGASLTPTVDNTYTVDRWAARLSQASKYSVQQNAGSVTLPVGYSNYLGVTSLSAYSVATGDYFLLQQRIEGYNISDLAWGTAAAKSVTLSFLVYSSLTGSFGGSIQNSTATRSYPFSYTVSAANTWTAIAVTITGDTAGTWLTNNGIGLNLSFNLGTGATYSGTAGAWAATNYVSTTGSVSVVGTSGSTFYITGVQLEKAGTATPFEYRPYGTELALCQRYCFVIPKATYMGNVGQAYSTTRAQGSIPLPVTMRVAPALTAITDYTGFNIYNNLASTIQLTAFIAIVSAYTNSMFWDATVASGLTGGNAALLQQSPTNVPLILSAEL